MSAPASGVWLLAAAGLFGWAWGSFLNTVVDRTPLRDPAQRGGMGPKLGWFTPPRSLCLACGTAIPAHDNLPVISYLLLRGRCRSCGTAIGTRTLTIEVATPMAFLALAWALHPLRHAPLFLWAAAALSAALVTVPMLAERRRFWGIALAWVAIAAGCALLRWMGVL